MEKNSMHTTTQNDKKKMGFVEFLDTIFVNNSVNEKVNCPCKNCRGRNNVAIKVAKDHLMAVGFAEGCAAKVTGLTGSSSEISGEKKIIAVGNADDIKSLNDDIKSLNDDIKLLNDLEKGLLPLKGSKLNDMRARIMQMKQNQNDLDESLSSMFHEFTKELFPFKEVEDLPEQCSEVASFGCEEEEKRDQPSASTSSGSVGCSTKEENRKKLREKINQRKESRWRRSR